MDPITPTTFEGVELVFAKDQPPYLPLPAKVCADGRVITEWQRTEEERALIAQGENIRLHVRLFPHRCDHCGTVAAPKLQPVKLEVTTLEEG